MATNHLRTTVPLYSSSLSRTRGPQGRRMSITIANSLMARQGPVLFILVRLDARLSVRTSESRRKIRRWRHTWPCCTVVGEIRTIPTCLSSPDQIASSLFRPHPPLLFSVPSAAVSFSTFKCVHVSTRRPAMICTRDPNASVNAATTWPAATGGEAKCPSLSLSLSCFIRPFCLSPSRRSCCCVPIATRSERFVLLVKFDWKIFQISRDTRYWRRRRRRRRRWKCLSGTMASRQKEGIDH